MQTKKTLTRDSIKHDLLALNAAKRRFNLIFISILFFIGAVAGAMSLLGILLTNSANLPGKITLGVLLSFFVCFMVWYTLWSLFSRLSEKKMIENGEFDITVMTVRDKDTRGIGKIRMGRPTAHFLYFDDSKIVEVESTEYNDISCGDELYVVSYKKNKKLRKVYSADRYRLHE